MQRAYWPRERAVEADSGDMHGPHPPAAIGVDDSVATQDVQARRCSGFCGRANRIRSEIGDRSDLDAVAMKIERRLVSAVVVGHHHRAPSGEDGEAVDVGPRRACQHHPGSVVVGKYQRPLQGPGGQHDPAGADAPQPLAREVSRRAGTEVVGDPFHGNQEIVIEISGDRGARERPHVRHRLQLGDGVAEPAGAGHVPVRGHVRKGAARLAALVGQDDPGAAAPRRYRGGQSGRSCTDDQDVAMRVVRSYRSGSAPSGARPMPAIRLSAARRHASRPRPHERLVVKPCRNQAVMHR